MKKNWLNKIVTFMLTAVMVFNLAAIQVHAEGDDADPADGPGEGKYVKEVFIAYGKDEDEAKEWLEENGWEPVEGDFNAGKLSYWDDNDGERVVAVMGIKRTDDKKDAVRDMAVMNMLGGYSVPQYDELLKQKKTEINEFINTFKVVLEEYRINYAGGGSEFGATRAKLADELLNTFYDGNPKDPCAANDTGGKMGVLLREKSRQEGNPKGVDLEQIVLESSGSALLAIEVLLTLAADTGKESWLERASGLTGDEMAENLPKYVPEAEGQDVAESAVYQFLEQHFGDTASLLAEGWEEIHDEMDWFEQYCNEHDLWQGEEESDEDFAARIDEYLAELRNSEDEELLLEADRFERTSCLYYGLYKIAYEGGWGETLGDFFNPADKEWNYPEEQYFLPLAAALSDGQRAGLEFVSAETLILLGLNSEQTFTQIKSELKKIIGKDTEFDVYTGVKREAFRGRAAITNEALMEQNAGRGMAFDEIWDNTGTVAISCYAGAIVGLVSVTIGSWMAAAGVRPYTELEIANLQAEFANASARLDEYVNGAGYAFDETHQALSNAVTRAQERLTHAQQGGTLTTATGYAGRVFIGIGGVLMLGAAVVKIVQLVKYYNRDMLPIPRMMVDESDIVTYLTDEEGNPILDENGKQKKNIDFNTYEYYTAVQCNRPVRPESDGWQDGVKEYKNHNCFDIADLNCDVGQEWLALYTVKSANKGKPILADTLTLLYGKGVHKPKNCSKALHLFTYDNAVDLGDTAWAFNNKKGGVYFFWGEEKDALPPIEAASFSSGQFALGCVGGLLLGILGSWLVLTKKRREEDQEAA